jgi:hypothetical protein
VRAGVRGANPEAPTLRAFFVLALSILAAFAVARTGLAQSEPGNDASEKLAGPEEAWAATVAGEVVPRGRIQVEVGATFADRAPGQNFSIETPIALRLGILEQWEARVVWSPYTAFEDSDHRREEGIGDAVFGLRYLVCAQAGYFPSIVAGGFAKAPFASEHEGRGSGEADIAARIDATTYWIEEVFYTDISIESAWIGQGRGEGPFFYQQTAFELYGGYDGLEPATLYSGISWETENAPGRDVHDSVVLTFGAFWFPRRWLAFDFGVDIGLGKDDADFGMYFTVIWLSGEIW